MKQGIFISYRRDTGSTMARMIFDRLRLEKNYQCFLDVEKLNAGNFRENILAEMDKCDIFLLVLSRNALNRCSDPNDNVRQEILAAMERKLAIIPVTSEDFTWPDTMPEGIESIQDYNAIPYIQVYSEQFFERLYSFIEKIRSDEKSGKPGRPSADVSAPDSGRSAAGTGKKTEGRSKLPVIIGAVAFIAVIAAIVILLGRGKDPSGKDGAGPEAPTVAVTQENPETPGEGETPESPAGTAVSETEKPETAMPEPTEEPTPEPAEEPTPEHTEEPAPAADSAGGGYAAFTPGSSMAEAGELPLPGKVRGTWFDGSLWASFTTGSDETAYYVTLQNLSAGSKKLYGNVYDEYGSLLRANSYSNFADLMHAEENGKSAYMKFDSLKPDTTYYVCITGSGKADYSVSISAEGQRNAICADKEVISDPEGYHTATNQDEAPTLTLNQKYKGRYENGYSWISFTTGSDDAAYYITLQNLSAGSKKLYGNVYDEYGSLLRANSYSNFADLMHAEENGKSAYMKFDSLKPDTTYYVCITGGGKADYSVSVSAEGQRNAICADKEVISDPEGYHTATNQDEAPTLTLNQKYKGRYDDGYAWISFTTGSDDATYYITLQNLSAGSKKLYGNVYDEYGNLLRANSYSNFADLMHAEENGKSAYMKFDSLKPDTTYYVCITGGGKADYSVSISAEGQRNAICADKEVISDPEGYHTATNQDEAPTLTLNQKYKGRYDDGYAWISFTTGSDDAEYYITLQNLSAGSKKLNGRVYDEYGNLLRADSYSDFVDLMSADESGKSAYMRFDSLKADTTYYICITGNGSKADYSVSVSVKGQQNAICTDKEVISDPEGYHTATNQDGAPSVTLNQKYKGRYDDGYAWISFTTGSDDAEYYITLQNLSAGSKKLNGRVYDEYGNLLRANSYSNFIDLMSADESGKSAYMRFDSLKADTTYYVCITGNGSKADYEICVSDHQ